MTYVKINDVEHQASIAGTPNDRNWNWRDSVSITLTMTHAQAAETFVNDVPWSIVERSVKNVLDEEGNPTGETTEVVKEYDNSDYSVAGSITDNRDGTVSVKMGKPTAEDMLRELMEVLGNAE